MPGGGLHLQGQGVTPRARRAGTAAGLLTALVVAVAIGRQTPSVASGAPPYRWLGPPNAALVLEEFSDFECPKCAQAQDDIKNLRNAAPDRIALVFHHAPLRQHAHAVPAARAAEAAGLQGKFWEYAERLFERQKEWAPYPPVAGHDPRPFLLAYARDLGLDEARFTADLDGTLTADRVRQDRESADRIAIPATPTVFVKDRMLVGASQIISMGPRFVQWALDQ